MNHSKLEKYWVKELGFKKIKYSPGVTMYRFYKHIPNPLIQRMYILIE